MKPVFILALLLTLTACSHPKSYLILTTNKQGDYGYLDLKGDTIIPFGKYTMCYTDTFRDHAIVLKPKVGLIAIDRNEKTLFHVFVFDNGPDYPSEGLFRFVNNGAIGYADTNFAVKIPAQYGCAFPFKNGAAKVSNDCKTIVDGEHETWVSNNWYYINKAGTRVKN